MKVLIHNACVLVLCFLLSVSSLAAQAEDPSFVIENNEVIKKEGDVVGRLEVTKDNSKTIFGAKKIKYLVRVYDSNNDLIAVCDVLSAQKSGSCQQIFEATLNTFKDRVLHAGSNFLDYDERKYNNEDEALQVSKLVSYLVHYKYI